MELRLALRRTLRQPLVPSAVVIALALAISVDAALFSVLDGLLFRPLPFTAPDRLVAVTYRDENGLPPELAYLPTFAERRHALREGIERSPLVAGTSQSGGSAFFPVEDARDLGLNVQGVDAGFFELFGLSPLLGTVFGVEEERQASTLSRQSQIPLPVVIGHDLWRRLYAADPAVLGVRELAGRTVRVVGVMGPNVKFPGETNVWAPVPSTRDRPPAHVRLAPAATLEQLASAFPELRFTPLRDAVHPGRARALPLLFGAAVVLLVVTWVQVASLLFFRSLGRIRDVGVRLALGARRTQIVRGFAIESTLVAATAFTLAWLSVRPLTAFIISMLPVDLRHGQYLDPDLRTFGFACTLSLVGFAILTAAPILLAWRVPALGLLNGGVAGLPLRVNRLRRVLLVGQITLTTLLLYLTGLAVHSFAQAVRFDYGFDADRVLVFTPPPWARVNMTTEALNLAFAERNRKIGDSVERLQNAPGVLAAATFFSAPLGVGIHPRGGEESLREITRLGGWPLRGIRARDNTVGVDFVRAFGATMIAGRACDAEEYRGRRHIVVINETLARRLQSAIGAPADRAAPSLIGRTIQSGSANSFEIVGVIKDLVDTAPDAPPDPQYLECGTAAFGVAIRATTSVDRALPAVRAALEPIWGPLRSRQFSLMRDELDRVLVPYRAQSVLLGLIAACCLPIAAIGLMGALTHSVRTRTREIAIRMAIGADPPDVRRAVVVGALATVGTGILLGTALGVAAGRIIAHELFRVRPADVTTMVAVTVGLLALAWLSALVPAAQASRVQPAEALRQE